MEQYKIKNHVKLIELFSGIGAQAMALRDLGVDFEHWKTSDWDVNAAASYKAIHFPDDDTDYSEGLDKEELIHLLHEFGISSNGKNPLSVDQLKRKGINWLKNTYNNFRASHNLGSIINIHAKDFELDPSDESVILLGA